MEARPSGFWKVAPELALILAVVLLIGLAVILSRNTRQIDHRLIGTWQSDADRTIALILGPPPYDDEAKRKEAKLRTLYGKMRITFTTTTWSSELDGNVDSGKYEVLGKDKVSVVIRHTRTQPDPLDFLELSSFRIVCFEGKDFYTSHSELSDEIFKRIK